MNRLTQLTTVLLFYCFSDISAQGQLNNWFFGFNHSINWECGGDYQKDSTAKYTTNINTTGAGDLWHFTPYTVSDRKTGKLLFNVLPGDKDMNQFGSFQHGGIYDNTNTYMQLSSGGPAEINNSEGRAVVVPAANNIWYVFYSGDNATTGASNHYSIIDMKLPGNGTAANPSGEVISHLNPLTFRGIQHVVRHSNEKDFWLITFDKVNKFSWTYDFKARLFSPPAVPGGPLNIVRLEEKNGIKGHASSLGQTFNPGSSAFSVDGSKFSWAAGIADFNTTTGEFSNDFLLQNANVFKGGGHPEGPPGRSPFFSHNCKYLYVAGTKTTARDGYLVRFEVATLSTASVPEFVDSNYLTESQSNPAAAWGLGSSFRLHNDGNVYFKNGVLGHISVLHNANSKGAYLTENWLRTPIFNDPVSIPTNLTARVKSSFFSGVIGDYLHSWPVEVAAQSMTENLINAGACDSATYEFSGESCGMVTSYLWDFGDGTMSSEKNPRHSYTASGNYTVKYMVANDSTCATWNIRDTISTPINVVVNPCQSCNTTIDSIAPLCADAGSIMINIDTTGGIWSGPGITDTTNGIFNPATAGPGNHTINYNLPSCKDTIAIVVNPLDDASFSFSANTICDSIATVLPTGIITLDGLFTIDNGGSIIDSTGEVDVALSGIGTYLVTHTTTGPCPDTATFNLDIVACTTPTAAFAVSDTAICAGECVEFTDLSMGATSWQWTFNGGTPNTANTQGPHNVCFNGPGTYAAELIVNNPFGSDNSTANITVSENPTINAGNDQTIKLGQNTTLNATGSDGEYNWTPPKWLDCPTCLSSLVTPKETVTYTVTVVDSNGCIASDEVTLIVGFDIAIFVPNIFSPNGDGNNDALFVRGAGVRTIEFVLFDRWGEQVFKTQSLDIGWDGNFRGKPMNNAVFMYHLKATFIDGSTTEQSGDVTLVR